MRSKSVEVIVYGAEQLCPSCLHSPSSKDTYEWLKAAIGRKFPAQPIKVEYVDIYNPPEGDSFREFTQKIMEEELFYPVVVINGKVVSEGNPRLKMIYAELENYDF